MQDISKYQKFAEDILGFKFDEPQHLITALTHRSYMNEHKSSATAHNERLEFLGDAVLELVVTEFLYLNYDEPEGILTNWRAALVRTESISAAGSRLGLYDLMRLSRGEKHGSDRAKQQIMANAFEAVIGAIYLDKGYKAASAFVHKHILATLEDILQTGSWRDPKSRLQEVAQSVDGETPVYKVLAEDGPDHDKMFTLGAYIGNKLRGKGSGPSKQMAQQEAAKNALKSYEK
ncbi:MAG TPA: ribonuclease III [Candidatus Saccharimonadales bacterium]|nr:ribonuclease III [Candidatus Saccharimonadales bacterium]